MAGLSEPRTRWILGIVGFGSFAVLLTLEILTEPELPSFGKVLLEALEILLTISAAGGVLFLAQRIHIQHREKIDLINDLKLARVEGESWRRKVQSQLAGIRMEMERQFRQWGMTDAEQEIGLLILKGLSHGEIAELRGTSETTVRQQAQSIYLKANLPGKRAFSAYFLEDLFMPQAMVDDTTS